MDKKNSSNLKKSTTKKLPATSANATNPLPSKYDGFVIENKQNKMMEIINDDFEHRIEKSIEELETVDELDSDYEDDFSCANRKAPLGSSNESLSDDGAVNEQDEVGAINEFPRTPEAINPAFFSILPYIGKRRLSECKEEDEDEVHSSVAKNSATRQTNGSVQTEVAGTTRRFIVTKTENAQAPVSPPVTIVEEAELFPEPNIVKDVKLPPVARAEIQNLRHMTPKMNSQTIHFPCSSGIGSTPNDRQSLKGIFSPQGILSPHLDQRFFDTSLVEIRGNNTQSNKSLDKSENGSISSGDNCKIDDVWIKRVDPAKKSVSFFLTQ